MAKTSLHTQTAVARLPVLARLSCWLLSILFYMQHA